MCHYEHPCVSPGVQEQCFIWSGYGDIYHCEGCAHSCGEVKCILGLALAVWNLAQARSHGPRPSCPSGLCSPNSDSGCPSFSLVLCPCWSLACGALPTLFHLFSSVKARLKALPPFPALCLISRGTEPALSPSLVSPVFDSF